jgi:hypothetical protein
MIKTTPMRMKTMRCSQEGGRKLIKCEAVGPRAVVAGAEAIRAQVIN